MFIITFTKLIKISRNLKNRIISINRLEPEDDDVEIKIKGKFKRKEEDMSKPPKWFKEFETKINKKITKLNENFENKTPKWFKDWNQKTFIPFKEKVEKDIIIMKQEIVEIKKDIVVIKKDINTMKNTPTMKKELGLS